jgi:flagellar biosynthetic protein FlhB
MADEDQDQKTEQPTGKRLDEARGRGQLPISRELGALILFIGIIIVLKWLAPPMASRLVTTLRIFLEMPHAIVLNDKGLQTVLLDVLVQVALATVLIFAMLLTVAVLGVMLQTGFFYSFELIAPNFGKLSPIAGLQRLFSITAAVELIKSFAKLIVLGLVVYFILKPVLEELPTFTGRDLMDTIVYMHQKAVHLIFILMLVFAVIALGDLFYQRWHYIKGLKMTKVEVKDEYKQQEGDPMIKSRLRQIRVEKARKRMMAQVPKADVVVTNPTHYAIALQYDAKRMTAPMVLAKGVDRVAERIREIAAENNIPMVSNPPLARTLYDTVEIDQEIPTQHYRAVAEIISFVYKLKKRKF